jgi:DNA polymerase I-like protein with 3'-5' exonuclease and polymerase domains
VLVSNSSAYGASPASLERKIEADTGVKPEEGTGQKLLDAIRARQPRATEFLEQMQEVPKQQGWYRAKSGRIRHCVMHARDSGVGYRTRNSIESAVGREMRNFPMQESVASTAARAGIELNKIYRQLGMKARVMTILYDSVVTLCPLEERFVCARLHEVYMHEENHWSYTDEFGTRKFAYPIDNEFNYRWSTKPSKDEQKELGDPEWHPTPDRLKFVENMRFSFA